MLRIFNTFPNKPWFVHVCITSFLKTLAKGEIVMSNFPFSHSVSYPFGELSTIFINLKLSSANCFSLEESRICRLGKVKINFFNPFPHKPRFLRVCSTTPLKTLWEKEKLLVMSNFSFSHSVFYPFGELPAIFIKFEFVVCRLFEFERV